MGGIKDVNNLNANGERGRQPSKALFENGTYDIEEFHDVFLEMEDITEYEPAIKLVGSWREWERLKRDWPAFRGHIQEWKEELEVKFRSQASRKIIELSDGDDAKALQAAKWVAEGGYNRRQGAGRPSKAEKNKEAKEIAMAAAETKKDEERILKVLNGGK